MSRRRSPLLALTRARLLEFVREPEALFWVFFFPMIMALVLGYAFRDKLPEALPVGVVEGPAASRQVAALGKSATLKPARFATRQEGLEALRLGRIALLVEGSPELVYRFDPTRTDARQARLEAHDALEREAGRTDPLPSREEPVREKGSRYIDFLVPGLLGLNLLSTSVWGIGFSIVNARMKKTLKLMTATPMRRSHYLLAQMLSRFVFLTGEAAAIVLFGTLVFDVPVRGSVGSLAFLCLFCALSFAGLGVLCGSRVQTFEGVNGLINLVLVPMWLFSGVFFSSERFPDAFQPAIRALPLTAANEALRAVMLEGRGLPALAAPIGIIALWGIVSFAVALKIFRWN